MGFCTTSRAKSISELAHKVLVAFSSSSSVPYSLRYLKTSRVQLRLPMGVAVGMESLKHCLGKLVQGIGHTQMVFPWEELQPLPSKRIPKLRSI